MPNNTITFTSPSYIMSESQLNSRLGFSVAGYQSSSNYITFDNVGYSVPDNAFYGDLTIYKIDLSGDVGLYSFGECNSLISASLPLTTIVPDGSFWGSTLLEYIFLPLANDIGGSSFAGCSVVNLSLPSATTIRVDAFGGCLLLESIYIPSATTIEDTAFFNCTSLIDVMAQNLITVGASVFYSCTSLESISLPSVTSIGNWCFGQCPSLIDVSLPLVASIGAGAFFSCINLESISLPLISSVPEKAFENCEALFEINIPIVSAGNRSFYGCILLTELSFPLLTTIGIECFKECTSLFNVSFPLLTSIPDSAFYEDTTLYTISLPSVVSVDSNAFYNCISLTHVSLPNAITVGGGNVFWNCSSLKTLYIPSCIKLGNTVGTDSLFFNISGKLIELTIPSFLLTCNSGNKDGDIQYLEANNTVTIIQIFPSIVYYSLDGGNTYINLYGSGSNAYYSGSVSRSEFNKLLPMIGSRYAIFKSYVSGTIEGSSVSNTTYIYVGGTHLQFTSYYTTNEHKYMCVVNRGEFTKSSNLTLYDISGSLLTSMESIDSAGTSSVFRMDNNFSPYATTIGLYDDTNRLVAFGKFANPIKIEKDLDSVFIVKFDG